MTSIDNFTVDLVSNLSMDIFPNNTLSKFENQIDPALELDGDWEVALTEIYFPLELDPEISTKQDFKFSIMNAHYVVYDKQNIRLEYPWTDKVERTVSIFPGDSIERILDKLNNEMEAATKEVQALKSYPKFILKHDKVSFSAGFYNYGANKYAKLNILTDPSHTEEIKNKIKQDNGSADKIPTIIAGATNAKHDIKFYYKNKYYGKCSVVGAGGEDSPEWSCAGTMLYVPQFQDKKILEYLGFDPKVHDFTSSLSSQTRDFEGLKSFEKGVKLMYVYTDIIRDHTVGGIKSPILRAIPLTTGIYSGIGYCTFEHRIYYPVRKNHIESVSVMLADATGEQIKFASVGKVFLSLDFRKKKLI